MNNWQPNRGARSLSVVFEFKKLCLMFFVVFVLAMPCSIVQVLFLCNSGLFCFILQAIYFMHKSIQFHPNIHMSSQ